METVKNFWQKLSQRERLWAYGAIIVFVVIVFIELVAPLWSKVEVSSKELQSVRDKFEILPNQIENFQKLYVKQQSIEKEFQQVSFEDGVLSHIETLIREEAKIDSIANYKILRQREREFSSKYVQELFKIELFVTSIPDLTNFLNQLVHGEKPLVLTSLDIKKAPNRTKLIVQLNVSNFKQINQTL